MNLPPFNIFPLLSDDKIRLRQIIASDMNELLEISYYDAKQAKNVAQAIEMQAKIDTDYDEGNSIHWGIEDISTNKIVGTCGYYRGLNKGEGELGGVLLPQFRGQGFMTNAMQLAIDFGLKNMELKRIWAITSKQNTQAIKLLKRLNFIKFTVLSDDEIEYELKK
ncbi:MAG: GNAT family N-acetyltransferase [Lutibacter sp.]|nr:GNAT family N-acetyltransferase [Lutibacter sp.]MDT8417765.1 GNAT family N-acetyltransferase [Lutibacter sp.]